MQTKHNISQIFIEISGGCNAKCPYCAQARLKRENHFGEIMSPLLFKQIVDHLFKIGIINKNDSVPIGLYKGGEPSLNLKINDILQILKNKKLKANISSNFIAICDIDKKFLSVIESMTFSLSGFSQDSYGRIHGASLKNVLNNFESFYENIRKYSPKTRIIIAWHRYLFNENEFWDAHKYFNRPGIVISPVIAFLNDRVEMIDFLNGKLSENRMKKAEKDIFIDYIRKRAMYHKKKSKNYYCIQWDILVIDESGQLLTCCCFTRYDSDHVLGNILDMSAEEIWNSKLSDPSCNECISCGFARFVHNINIDTPLPPGGGLYGLKTKFYYKPKRVLFQCENVLGQLLRKLPNSEKIIYIIKKLK